MAKGLRLLDITHWALKAAIVVSVLFALTLVLALGGMGVVATNLDGNHLGLPATLRGVPLETLLPFAAFAVTALLICVLMVTLALLLAARIVKTAVSGDPFVTQNAKRLTLIGWLLLAVQLVGAAMDMYVDHLHKTFPTLQGSDNSGFGLSPIGILTVLLILVLAQIFRRGSEMRAELEATV